MDRPSSSASKAEQGPPEPPPADIPPANPSEAEKGTDGEEYILRGFKLFLILACLLASVFCQAIDETIIATATPRITDQFHRLNDVGWYGSAYLLTNCAFQLFWGKLYNFLPLRWVFLASLAIFELGSLISAVSPTSPTLIGGRAVAGTGAAGITTGAFTIMAHVTPVHRRPLFASLIGAVYGVAAVAGPLIGGAFAQNVTWRWNFYLNLPIGGVAALGPLLLLHRLPASAKGEDIPFRVMLRRVDPIGTLTFVPSIICLLLALQWAGIQYPWDSGRIIALLVVFAVLLVAFVITQIFQPDPNANATVPPRLLTRDRSMPFGGLFALCQGAAFNLFVYYLPLYFQAVKNATPIQSGVDYLPLLVLNTVAILGAGALTSKIGYYVQWIYASSVLMAVGAGLLTLLRPDSSTGRWVGFQILFAIGSGLGLQQPFVVAQTVVPLEDISKATAFMLFCQLGGGAIFVSAALQVFASTLISSVAALDIPGLNPTSLVSLGATQFRSIVPAQSLNLVLDAYNNALVHAYRVGLIMSCISVLGAAGMRWVNVNKDKNKGDDNDKKTPREDQKEKEEETEREREGSAAEKEPAVEGPSRE